VPVLELSRPPVASPEAEDEFRKIYEAHFEQVWHSLRRLSVAERDLMDATQNVFVVVFRKLHEFEGRAQLRTWIFQICRRVASDYRRSAPVRRELLTDSVELNARAEQMSFVPIADEHGQRVNLARTILDKLPEAQREVFILFELEQLSGEEIATLLELPLGTVRSRLRLAREAFRREVALFLGEGPEQKAG
jgi:RNA polymerase sigma-70 factor (ECF subfamily)